MLRVTNTDTENGNDGDKIVIFNINNNDRKLVFNIQQGDVSNQWYYKHPNITVQASTWYNVVIKTVYLTGSFRVRIYIDNVLIKENWFNEHPSTFNDVKVYVSEKFKKPIAGWIDNLNITTGEVTSCPLLSLCFCPHIRCANIKGGRKLMETGMYRMY